MTTARLSQGVASRKTSAVLKDRIARNTFHIPTRCRHVLEIVCRRTVCCAEHDPLHRRYLCNLLDDDDVKVPPYGFREERREARRFRHVTDLKVSQRKRIAHSNRCILHVTLFSRECGKVPSQLRILSPVYELSLKRKDFLNNRCMLIPSCLDGRLLGDLGTSRC